MLCVLAACHRGRAPNGGIAQLERQATGGDPMARYDLAVDYFRGDSIPRDYARAAALWQQLAAQGSASAMNDYAFLLYNGFGVPAEPDSAVRLWIRASQLGEPESQYHLGYAALDGEGEPRDTVEAVARFRASIAVALRTGDPTDSLVATDARQALASLPPLEPAAARKADRLARTYSRVIAWVPTRERP